MKMSAEEKKSDVERANEEHENPGKHKEIRRKTFWVWELTANEEEVKAFF